MASEMRQLLQRIEDEHLACRRGLTGLASVARHDFIQAKQERIDQCHSRLLELVGDGATQFVADIIDAADLLYDCDWIMYPWLRVEISL
ncbi:MAG: hypothetical protein ACRDHW_01430 [Ktedonobacteraceae bacterium]